ncbi:egl nine homolog 1 isoform X3 [Carassius gibelio]|uniref:egl nine homolog 1 isoform X3 n=1 Tax=Carassius gibelio TaxID=101364 RepID=UPI0022780DB2|nr:egl nine homolog 1 isoform X3 [Carassius gibelio]
MDQCTTALDPDQDKQFCELCGKMENLLKCGRCRISFYCSKEHQKQHWKEHKLTCIEADKTKTVPQTPHQQEKPTDPETKDLITRTASSEADSTTTKPQTHKLATDYIVPCMNKHGICVVDNFLGEDMGLSILENVKALQQSGKFTEGQLVSQKSDSTKDIRGDIITWIEGKEPGCEKICFLMSRMDDLVRNCNGKLGNYSINGRTKISLLIQTRPLLTGGSVGFMDYGVKHTAFVFSRCSLMDWSAVDYCDVFISCLDPHSDGTHSLQSM